MLEVNAGYILGIKCKVSKKNNKIKWMKLKLSLNDYEDNSNLTFKVKKPDKKTLKFLKNCAGYKFSKKDKKFKKNSNVELIFQIEYFDYIKKPELVAILDKELL